MDMKTDAHSEHLWTYTCPHNNSDTYTHTRMHKHTGPEAPVILADPELHTCPQGRT